MFSTSLVAVPAFSRVDPAMTSAPTPGAIVRSTNVCNSVPGSHVTKMIRVPTLRAIVSAPRTNCVIPLAETPMTMSFLRGRRRETARAPSFVVILDTFFGREDGVATSGHDCLYVVGLGSKGRWHLGGFENTQPSTGTGADEDDSSAFAERRCNHLDANGDTLALAPYGFEHPAIFVEHQVDDVVGGELVDAETERVDGLGRQGLPL